MTEKTVSIYIRINGTLMLDRTVDAGWPFGLLGGMGGGSGSKCGIALKGLNASELG